MDKMIETEARILEEVSQYYSETLAQHGTTAKGVDWNGEESQRIRFAQLVKIIGDEGKCSINDLGCGYGALYDFLVERGVSCDYCGVDVALPMIEAARVRHCTHGNVLFHHGPTPIHPLDYCVASGIFNVRLTTPPHEWERYLLTTLQTLDKYSLKGFAFNCLTSYSDSERMKSHLYYADPCKVFDFCKRKFSNQVALLHDYGLFEFTILVRK